PRLFGSWWPFGKPKNQGRYAQMAVIYSSKNRYDFDAAKDQVAGELEAQGHPLAPDFTCECWGIGPLQRDKRMFLTVQLSRTFPDRFPLDALDPNDQRIALFPFGSKDGADGVYAVYVIHRPGR